MKQLVLGNGQARVEEVPEPTPEPGWVVVKVMVTPICGSDRGAFLAEEENRWGGHEGAGVVAETAEHCRFKRGDRVLISPAGGCGTCPLCLSGDYIYCPNGPPPTSHFAQYVKKKEDILRSLPDDVSFEVGSLGGCALSPGFSALDRMRVGAFDTVLVTGLGPVGLGAVAIASFRGARVLGVEPEAFRRNLALEVGAEETFDPTDGDALEWTRQLTDGTGVSCAVECSGKPDAERLCMDAAATLGQVAFAGENQSMIEVSPSRDFIRKGLTVLGTWHMNLLDFPKLLTLMRRKPEIEKIITHTFAFERAREAFETFLSGKSGKVLLKPWE